MRLAEQQERLRAVEQQLIELDKSEMEQPPGSSSAASAAATATTNRPQPSSVCEPGLQDAVLWPSDLAEVAEVASRSRRKLELQQAASAAASQRLPPPPPPPPPPGAELSDGLETEHARLELAMARQRLGGGAAGGASRHVVQADDENQWAEAVQELRRSAWQTQQHSGDLADAAAGLQQARRQQQQQQADQLDQL
eukprot:SAG22_NODE_1556_length_4131_cov_3.350942_6_plen_196_part_00